MGNVQLRAEAFREGGVWRVRLIGPFWLLDDLAREMDDTGQQLDIVALVPEIEKDQMFGHILGAADLSVAPRRKRAKPSSPRQSGKEIGPVVVDREAFFKL